MTRPPIDPRARLRAKRAIGVIPNYGWPGRLRPAHPPVPTADPEPTSPAECEALLRALCAEGRVLRVAGDARQLEVVLLSGASVEVEIRAGQDREARAILGDSERGTVTVAPGGARA